jgi:hypothetical protein
MRESSDLNLPAGLRARAACCAWAQRAQVVLHVAAGRNLCMIALLWDSGVGAMSGPA